MTHQAIAHSPLQGVLIDEHTLTAQSDIAQRLAATAAAPVTMFDCSLLPRWGLRGAKAGDFLASQHMPLPERPNLAAQAASGETIMRLGANEYWLLGAAEDAGLRLAERQATPLAPEHGLALFPQHSHAWLLLTGAARAQLMAKLCAVDLNDAAFPLHSVCQTEVAHISTIIVHHTFAGHNVFSLLCDTSYAHYYWHMLEDAVQHPL